jgi:uncharacterized protein YuzE
MTTDMTHDPKANAVYVYLGRGEVVSSEEVSPDMVLDYDVDGRTVGIEVLNAREALAARDWLTAANLQARRAEVAE